MPGWLIGFCVLAGLGTLVSVSKSVVDNTTFGKWIYDKSVMFIVIGGILFVAACLVIKFYKWIAHLF